MSTTLLTNITQHWQTSLAGVLTIALGILPLFGVEVPGFHMEPSAAIAAGLALLVARDPTK